jgi:hypothetical protein
VSRVAKVRARSTGGASTTSSIHSRPLALTYYILYIYILHALQGRLKLLVGHQGHEKGGLACVRQRLAHLDVHDAVVALGLCVRLGSG